MKVYVGMCVKSKDEKDTKKTKNELDKVKK